VGAPAERPDLGARTFAWCAVWLVLGALNFAGNELAKRPVQKTPEFFTYSLGVGGIVLNGVLLGVTLLIALDLPKRRTFALYRPHGLARGLGIAVLTVAITIAVGVIVQPFLHPARKQGILPEHGWVPGHVAAFVLSVIAVSVAAPVVEELLFRGLGFSLLLRFGRSFALAGVGIAFGVAHGIPEALPILVPLGAGLAWLRDRTQSVFPGMVVHALFNAVQVIFAVT
jgi:uncharacterized protein